MSEIVDVHSRYVRDLTTPNELPADLKTFEQVKFLAGNFPVPYIGCEALTLGQISALFTLNLDDKLSKKADITSVYTKEETYSKAENNQQLSTKADVISVYTKDEVYSKTENDQQLNTKVTQSYVDAAVGAISTDASKQYATLTLANADIANIPLNKIVFVSESVNGGYWYKATAGATSLMKSPYDPLVQAKDYSDTKTFVSSSSNILELRDLHGKLVTLISNKGGLYIPNLDKSVQSFLKMLENSIAEVNLRLNYDESTAIINVVDKNEKLVLSVTKSGSLHVYDVLTRGGSVEKRLRSLEDNSTQDVELKMLKMADRTIATKDNDAYKQEAMIFSLEELSSSFVFASSICRISKREFLIFCEGRLGGDFDPAKIFVRKVTVNNDYSLTLGDVSVLADSGGTGTEAFSCINACSLKVKTGTHSGRVYLYYIKRFYNGERDETYQIYSDDDGITWSIPIDMSQFMPNFANWRVVAIGPAKAIQLKKGEHKGRIILPCWHGDLNYPSSQAGLKSFVLYSDDGGDTYTVGAESMYAGSNECQVAELNNGGFALLTRDASQQKAIEYSYDGGLTFVNPRKLSEIVTTRVQSGFLQCENEFDLSVPKLIVSTPSKGGVREDIGLWVSYDEKNFEFLTNIQTGLASYSDLINIDESSFLVTYSAGRADANRDIKATVINLKNIYMNG